MSLVIIHYYTFLSEPIAQIEMIILLMIIIIIIVYVSTYCFYKVFVVCVVQCRLSGKRLCGRGRRVRVVMCHDTVTSRTLPGQECLSEDKPQNTSSCRVPCNSPRRHHYRYKWRRGPWSRVKYPKQKRKPATSIQVEPNNRRNPLMIHYNTSTEKGQTTSNSVNKPPSTAKPTHVSAMSQHNHLLHIARIKKLREAMKRRKRKRGYILTDAPNNFTTELKSKRHLLNSINQNQHLLIPPDYLPFMQPNKNNIVADLSMKDKLASLERQLNSFSVNKYEQLHRHNFSPSLPNLHHNFINRLRGRHPGQNFIGYSSEDSNSHEIHVGSDKPESFSLDKPLPSFPPFLAHTTLHESATPRPIFPGPAPTSYHSRPLFPPSHSSWTHHNHHRHPSY